MDTRPTKKRKTPPRTVSLDRQVQSLRRVIYSNKPEVRQASYDITIAANSTNAAALIDPTLIDAGTEEIKLHRILVSWLYITGDVPWGIIFSPRQGYLPNQLPDSGAPYSVNNFLKFLDQTKQRVFSRRNFGREIATGADSDSVLEMNKKFSIPMKVGMSNPGVQSAQHNQLYWIGGHWNDAEPRVISVTVWYTSS